MAPKLLAQYIHGLVSLNVLDHMELNPHLDVVSSHSNQVNLKLKHLGYLGLRVSYGSFSEAHHKNPNVRNVPFAASQAANLSVSYVESSRSELIDQRPRSALSRH